MSAGSSTLDDLPRVPERLGLSRAAFAAEVVPAYRPVVVRGLAADWPAVTHGREGPLALARYLHGFTRGTQAEVWIGEPARGGAFGYAPDLTGFDFRREEWPIGHLFAALMESQDSAAVPPVYAGALPLAKHFPGLAEQCPVPLLAGRDDALVSLWIGNGSRTATHWDLPQNLACVIAGTRRFLLFPPEQLPNLYVGPIDLTLAGQPISLVDPHAPDLARFPLYADALAHAQVAELGPGDALYVPAMWWHHVETPGRFGAQVNFWWRDAAAHMVTPLYTLLHALLTIRDLPPPEREAWRGMFDHYVFGANGDPAAHIPRPRAGCWGR